MRMQDFSYCPTSIYRLQFNKDFTFKEAINVLLYLKNLGIQAIYCSPFYECNSSHGYDVTNPNMINPDVGSKKDFQDFCRKLKKLKMGQIIDVVPNHMGIKAGKNVWWQDILENGPFSEYATFFDIQWYPEKRELQDKVLLCILPEDFGHVLENQIIKLVLKDSALRIQFYDFFLPISFQSYSTFLEHGWHEFKAKQAYAKHPIQEYEKIIEIFKTMPLNLAERAKKKEAGLFRLAKLIDESSLIKQFINNQIILFNGKKKNPSSFNLLEQLLEKQFYRLASWKVAAHEINYRRFFDINELAAIRIEQEIVFEMHHQLIFNLVHSGKVQGLRIDHPDGLFHPAQYFERLRQKCKVPIIVEKILDRKEELSDWDVDGTVGYEFINILNGIFIDPDSEEKFTQIYENFIGQKMDFDELLYQKKKLIAKVHMVSEISALGYRLDTISEHNRYYKDFTRKDLIKALEEVIACFPVYRSYITPEGDCVSKRDANYIKIAIQKARRRSPYIDDSVFDFIQKLLLLKLKIRKEDREDYRAFILRFQQLSGPVMAKGLEDTCFYVYNRFISLNEVGGDPEHFGVSVAEFHRFNQRKLKNWPLGFLASSTHDTKRSEDVRMRLNVLSEIPNEWEAMVKKWSVINSKHQLKPSSGAPSLNTEYFIYQSLIGIWPLNLKTNEWQVFIERFWNLLVKSMREAKVETNWKKPNTRYEEHVRAFIYNILEHSAKNSFLRSFLPFQKKISLLGRWNSLSAIAIKNACPGIVDMYQGTELWNYHLVDPDNRQKVDYRLREHYLKTIQKKYSQHESKYKFIDKLFKENDWGLIKQFLDWKTLGLRNQSPELFLEGDYMPLNISGNRKNHIIAFMRKWKNSYVIVIATRFFSDLINESIIFPLGSEVWEGTEVTLPFEKRARFFDLFTNEHFVFKGSIPIQSVLTHLPFSYLCSENLQVLL